MKGEALVVILASEGLAQVAVSCQHARRSFVPQCTKIQKISFLRIPFVVPHVLFFFFRPCQKSNIEIWDKRRGGFG